MFENIKAMTLAEWLSDLDGLHVKVITGTDGNTTSIALYSESKDQMYIVGTVTTEPTNDQATGGE